MPGRRGDRHRLTRWLWTSRRLDARLVRTGLLPLAALWRGGGAARNPPHRRGWLGGPAMSLPRVPVGSLTAGGAGETPHASWIAPRTLHRRVGPALLLP